MVKKSVLRIVESRRRNMLIATCAAYARNRIAGPTTNPFHPRLAAPKATPARTALDIAYLRSFATAPIARIM